MQEPDWAKVLNTIYKKHEESPSARITPDHSYVKETNLDVNEVTSAISTLKSWGLISKEIGSTKGMVAEEKSGRVPDDEAVLRLTEKGFDVAHDREMQSNHHRTNNAVVFLTVFVAFGSVVQAYSAYLTHGVQEQLPLIATMILFLIIVFFLISYVLDWNI